jgi:parallel beta-helix repeat protein
MIRQGFYISLLENFRNSYGKHFASLTPLGLTTLLFLGAGLKLVAAEVNASATDTTLITAQAPASGSVIYVDPQTGQDSADAGTTQANAYKTITYALSVAQPGTVIQLAPGTYNKENGEQFPLLLKEGVTLRGDESSKGQGILITGGGYYTSRTFARQDITILANNNTTITGVSVTNPNQRGTGVWVESTNPTITNNTFTNSVREGVFVTGTGAPKIENNVFVQNQGNGVSVAKSAKGEIRNNLFQDTGFGIAVSEQATPLIVDNQILQNNGGVVVTGAAQPILRNNVIQDNRDNGIVALGTAQPNLGTQQDPGKNLIRNNGRKDAKKYFDVLNATKTSTIVAVGNDIDPKRISGQVDFVAADVEPPLSGGQVGFKDVPTGYWAKTYIEALAAKNIIAGFPDNTFKPNEPVTRAQFAAIVTKAFQPQSQRPATNFTDVNRNFWGYNAILSAYQGGFVSGYPNRTFRPQQEIPRVQALVSLANGLRLSVDNQNVLSFYSDASQIPNYAIAPVAAATARQLVVNYPTPQQLNPNRPATRAEVAAFVYQALVNSGRAEAIASPYLVRVP